MIRLILLSACALSSCGGGGGEQPSMIDYNSFQKTSVSPPYNETKYYVTNLNPDDYRQDTPCCPGSWEVWARHLGSDMDSVSSPEPANAISLTGASNPSMNVKGNGSSYYRVGEGTMESYFDTSLTTTHFIRGAGPHIILSTDFYQPAIGTGIIGDFKMPFLETNGGVLQLSLFSYFKSRVDASQPHIGFVNLISDNRPEYANLEPYVGHDTYTYFASQRISDNRYATPLTHERYSTETFADERRFGFVVTKQNLTNLLGDLKVKLDESMESYVLDMNPDNYQMSIVGIMHEGFTFHDPNIYVRSGYSVRNINVFTSDVE